MSNRRDFLRKLAAVGATLGLSPFAINRMIGSDEVKFNTKHYKDNTSENGMATMISTWKHGMQGASFEARLGNC